MSDFYTLPPEEQTSRLERLARRALEEFGVVPSNLSVLSTAWNTVFRVDTEEGRRYVIRVCLPFFTETAGREEVEYMAGVAEQSDIDVPRPVMTPAGESVVQVSIPEVPEPRVTLLFPFVEGEMIRKPTPEDVIAWGDLSARLHTFAEGWRPAGESTRPTFRKVLPFSHDRLVIFEEAYGELIAPHADLLRSGLHETQKAIDEIYSGRSGPPLLLHNDLHPGNILRHGEHYTVIDFEEIMWSYPVQDAGIALFYMVHREDFGEILAGYREGYTRHRPWLEENEGELDTMMVVRDLWLLNTAMQQAIPERIERLGRYLPILAGRLRRWLESGKIV